MSSRPSSASQRRGDRTLYESAAIRYHAYLDAKDKIREALADAVEERDARNPFQCQRDELVTQDMHTCDLCGRRVSSPVRAISLDVYRLFERWRLSQSEADE